MLGEWNGEYLQTDTASVLMEAIGYIKFLQNQVEVRIYVVLNLTSSNIILWFLCCDLLII